MTVKALYPLVNAQSMSKIVAEIIIDIDTNMFCPILILTHPHHTTGASFPTLGPALGQWIVLSVPEAPVPRTWRRATLAYLKEDAAHGSTFLPFPDSGLLPMVDLSQVWRIHCPEKNRPNIRIYQNQHTKDNQILIPPDIWKAHLRSRFQLLFRTNGPHGAAACWWTHVNRLWP